MGINFDEVSGENVVLTLQDAYIYHWDKTHFDSYYKININEYDKEKKIIKTTKLENLFWENWTLSAELYRAWHDKKSQQLNIDNGSYDNNFGLAILADETVPKIIFEIGTGVNYYRPIPYGTSYFQDIYWDDLLRISREVLVMELKGLKKKYQEKMKDNKEIERFNVVSRLTIIEEGIEFYSSIEDKKFSHPGNIIESIIKEAEKLC